MNRNFTQKEVRNFVAKIAGFLNIVPALQASLWAAGNAISIRYNIPAQHQPFSTSIIPGYFNLIKNKQPQLMLNPAVVNQF